MNINHITISCEVYPHKTCGELFNTIENCKECNWNQPKEYLEGENIMNGAETIQKEKQKSIKKQKDFDSYVENYLEYAWKYLLKIDRFVIKEQFKRQEYEIIQFEYKIGLLKFICDDLQYEFHNILYDLKEGNSLWNYASVIKGICPNDFIISIFK
jgi:hypothetical protein